MDANTIIIINSQDIHPFVIARDYAKQVGVYSNLVRGAIS